MYFQFSANTYYDLYRKMTNVHQSICPDIKTMSEVA